MNRNKPDNINYNFCKLSKKESKDLKSYNKILSKIRQLKNANDVGLEFCNYPK